MFFNPFATSDANMRQLSTVYNDMLIAKGLKVDCLPYAVGKQPT